MIGEIHFITAYFSAYGISGKFKNPVISRPTLLKYSFDRE